MSVGLRGMVHCLPRMNNVWRSAQSASRRTSSLSGEEATLYCLCRNLLQRFPDLARSDRK